MQMVDVVSSPPLSYGHPENRFYWGERVGIQTCKLSKKVMETRHAFPVVISGSWKNVATLLITNLFVLVMHSWS